MQMHITRHAASRRARLGIKDVDFETAIQIGSHTDDGVVVSDRDIDREVTELRSEIARLERLRGFYFACPGESLVTVYRPRPERLRRIMRNVRKPT
jgi:hypothetical protein